MNKSAFMIFASQNRRAVRSAPLINSIFPAIIIPEHRAKTTILKEKNWEQLLPITPFPPPHSDESLSFARQRRKFFTGKTRRKIALFLVMKMWWFMIFTTQNRSAHQIESGIQYIATRGHGSTRTLGHRGTRTIVTWITLPLSFWLVKIINVTLFKSFWNKKASRTILTWITLPLSFLLVKIINVTLFKSFWIGGTTNFSLEKLEGKSHLFLVMKMWWFIIFTSQNRSTHQIEAGAPDIGTKAIYRTLQRHAV